MLKRVDAVVQRVLQRTSLSWRATLRSAGLAGFAGVCCLSFAAGDGSTPSTPAYYEQGNLVRAGEVVQGLGPNLMGDSVNEYSGGLEFTQTDFAVPGNNVLPMSMGRHLTIGTRQAASAGGLFGDWDLEIPHMHTISANTVIGGQAGNWNGASNGVATQLRCAQFSPPGYGQGTFGTVPASIVSWNWWDGYHLYVPGAGDQTVLARNPSTDPRQPMDGNAYPLVTKANWQFRCLPSLANGAGDAFLALAPDGTRYQFDRLVSRPYTAFSPPATGPRLFLARSEVWILPSQITDRFGNWVRYSYDATDNWRVTSIQSSDGRQIGFTYFAGTHRVQSASDGTRTWTYAYDATGALQTVTQPDASTWRFSLGDLERDNRYAGDPSCTQDFDTGDGFTHTGTITHPAGAVGTFTVRATWHARSNVPWGSSATCFSLGANPISTYFSNYSLVSKTLAGPGMPAMTWLYEHGNPIGSWAPCNGCVNTKTVTITDPSNNVIVNTYGTMFGVTEGLLLNSSVSRNGGISQATAYSYASSNAGPYPTSIGTSGAALTDSMSGIYTPQSQRVITQQGVTFTQTVTAGFDEYARPKGVTRSSSLGTSRIESTGYYDNTNLWVLGQVKSQTIAGVGASSTTFNTTTALPITASKFGKLRATYAFNADGTMRSITDGLNHTTTFGSYKRGLPQTIGFADGRSISAVVNNIGAITSAANEVGTIWNYGYDAMGRLASKTPPGGDLVAYNTTTLSFVQVPTAEVGLEANHWRQTITTGNAVTINYFDARWRKRLTTTYDAANRASTERAQRFDYDPYNRTTFAAYPARAIAAIAAAVPGTTTTYDALGRPTQTVADSELGALTTTTQYLTGFKKRVTDARGNVTTTAYQVFDEPSESAIASIAAPEGLNVTISRDVLGKPLAIKRSGTYGAVPVSATRGYVYDAYQLLCKTIEPEIGATIQALDAADNVAWRASGLSLTSTSSCDWASVPGTSMVSYTYDPRNRVAATGFGDGSPSIGRSYTPDGLPQTVVSNGSTWTYGYNSRRLLIGESLAYGQTFNIGRSYDANGNLSQLTYPDGAVVAYSPNALGEATQASGYASGVSYHPNGAVAGYTLANGIVHTLTQNTRGLPRLNRDTGVVQDLYDYDANGNVTAINDQQEGVSSRSMAYDGLDRLITANAPGVWGVASYTYDQLGNVRTSTVGSRNSTHNYGANNLLAAINSNGVVTGYAYDPRGNVTGRGSQGFYFDLGNRMALANGLASYAYDGWGRRVSVNGASGVARTQVYSDAGGQLLYSQTRQGMNTWLTRYVYLGGKLIAETDGSAGTSYAHTDALGSPVARTSSSGLSRTRYEPYGKTAAGTNPGGNGFTGVGFTGHVNDAETGLVYMQQRYYDPEAARFMSVDPVVTDANSGAMFARYEYANNNPYRYTDPDGQEAEQSVTVKLPPQTGSNIPPTVTMSSNGSVSTTNMGVSPLSGGIQIAQLGSGAYQDSRLTMADRVAGIPSSEPRTTSGSANLSMNVPVYGLGGIHISFRGTAESNSLYLGAGLVVGSSFSFAPRLSEQLNTSTGSTEGMCMKISMSTPGFGPVGITGSFTLGPKGDAASIGPAIVGGRPSGSVTGGYNFQ